ncbi:MAG TPA: ABC transporter ATP-binding protein [Aquifex aeolicus]|nr:ABC transporter ATP-binding protein [Aquifex aeolicus]
MTVALRVLDIHKSFGGNKVLRGVSLWVDEGETVGIVGPNGSGKTTLINIIGGILRQDEGKVFLGDRDISELRPNARAKLGIGRTFQITRLFSGLSVLENVMVALHYGSPLRASRKVAMDILSSVGLVDMAHSKASALSLAQRKRLELARALALKPKVLLLDEVFAGLNPTSIREMVSLLKDLRDREGITLVVVEHVLKALFRLTERVIVLSEGRVIFDGSPEEMARDREVIRAYLGERYGKEIT